MRAIKRDVAYNIRGILGSYESIEAYVQSQWGLGITASRHIEAWYWRTH